MAAASGRLIGRSFFLFFASVAAIRITSWFLLHKSGILAIAHVFKEVMVSAL